MPSSLLFIAGICAGFGVLYLFIAWKREQDRALNLTFAFFALAYAGANIMAVATYHASTISYYITNNHLKAAGRMITTT